MRTLRIDLAYDGSGFSGWAAQLAYYLLFAVFPFFLFLTALLGFLPIPNLMERIIGGLAMVLPGEVVTLLQDNIRQLVTEQKGGLLSFGINAAKQVEGA